MKKLLIVLSVLVIAVGVLAGIFASQKADLQKKVDGLTAEIATLKKDLEAAKTEGARIAEEAAAAAKAAEEAAAAAKAAEEAAAKTVYLGLATGGTTGTYYPLGGDIAALWMAKIPNLDVTAQSTGGSKANIILINEGDAELATVQNDVAYYAYQGDKDFFAGQVIDSFMAIGALYPEYVQIVVAADSGIKTVSDLKGKKVGIGAVGSGVYFNAVQILGKAGITLDDIDEQYLSFDESATSFQNLQIDAFFVTAGLPNTSIIEVANKREINLIGLQETEMASLMADYQFYVPVTVPAGTYNGIKEDVTVPAVSAILICSKDLGEDLVYNLCKVLYEDTAELSHAKKQLISAAYAVTGIPVPFHPGAAKYFSEIGLPVK